uniref:Uncharacterized protein n=1 Tax=Anopheles atroparvus TaxID=41427 RepID=A0AAG5DBU2_ANOAO
MSKRKAKDGKMKMKINVNWSMPEQEKRGRWDQAAEENSIPPTKTPPVPATWDAE